jgi:hypothetical protein
MRDLKELGKLVAKSEDQLFDLPRIEALSEALDFALSLIPGWDDRYIGEARKAQT